MTAYPSLFQISDLVNSGDATRINGEGAYDLSGIAVAGGGDVNGDGFDDVLIGAIGALGLKGAAYVVYGGSGLGSDLDLTSLDGTNGFQLNGAAAGDRTGSAVAIVGDFNGDGVDDMLIGAYGAGPNGPLSGASYVVFGQTGAMLPNVKLSGLDGTNGFKLNGEAFMDFSGRSVAGAGDVNGDGFDDLIIGAYRASPNGKYSGAAYVVFGKASGFASDTDLSALDGSNGFRINGAAAYDKAGLSVAGGCDINGDGFDDLIVGAQGHVYVLFGKASGFGSSIDLSDIDGTNGFRFDPASAYDLQSPHLACGGDINGDGVDDLVIGDAGAASGAGATYVVFGRQAGVAAGANVAAAAAGNGPERDGPFAETINEIDLDGGNGFRVFGDQPGDNSGNSVAVADVDGDGIDDLVIGAEGTDHNGDDSGSVHVIFGKRGGFDPVVDVFDLNGDNGFRIDGAAENDKFGTSVSAAGDVDGDGLADVVVGATGVATNGMLAGASYIIHGMKPQEAVNRTGTARDDHISGSDFGDVLKGLDGDDFIFAFGGKDFVFGGLGNDLLQCGTGADIARGGAGDDTAYGDAGNDVIGGGGGDDAIDGGGGNDTERGGAGDDLLLGGLGRDLLTGQGGNDTERGGAGADLLLGGLGRDLLIGQGGNDTERGGAGADVINGNGGNDVIDGGGGNDIAKGGAGADDINGKAGDDHLLGGGGNDVVSGGGGDDAINGNGGNDVITGGNGDDTINGGGGNDEINGNNGSDFLTGGNGNDVINGRGGNDFISANLGDDTVHGGSGADDINGNAGDDHLFGDGGDDVINGDSGNDAINGGDGRETIHGGTGSDTIRGGNGSDFLFGDEGIDVLRGGSGGDVLSGGDGGDYLNGDSGGDVLNGGMGADLFIFTDGFGLDTIQDFDSADAEKINLAGVSEITDFNDLVNHHLGSDVFTNDALIIIDAGNVITLEGVHPEDIGPNKPYSEADFIFSGS